MADNEYRKQLREKARERYGSDSVQVDEDADFSESDEGTWVQAWVWVPAEDTEED
jgi:hypothetical protein